MAEVSSLIPECSSANLKAKELMMQKPVSERPEEALLDKHNKFVRALKVYLRSAENQPPEVRDLYSLRNLRRSLKKDIKFFGGLIKPKVFEKDKHEGYDGEKEGDLVSLREIRSYLKGDVKHQMPIEGSSMVEVRIRRALKRDLKFLKRLQRVMIVQDKLVERMEKLMVENDGKNEVDHADGGNQGAGAGNSDDDDDDKGKADGVGVEDDEDGEYSTDTENRARELRKFIKEDDDGFIPLGEHKVNYRKWARYYKQLDESEGFDIVDFPGCCIMAFAVPIPTLSNPHLVKMASIALQAYNSKMGKDYKFHKVVRANARNDGLAIFYITFEAMNPDADYAIEAFQAHVHWGPKEKFDVKLIRPKNAPRGTSQ